MTRLETIVVKTFGERFKGFASFPVPLLIATGAELQALFNASDETVEQFTRVLARETSLPLVRSSPCPGDQAARARPFPRVATGIPGMDRVLGGGLAPGSIYHVFGAPGSGKMEVCHHLVKSFLGASPTSKVYLVDADLRFHPGRLVAHGVPVQDLTRVHVSKCHSLHHLGILLDNVARLAANKEHPLLVVLDSLAAPALRASTSDAIEWHRMVSRLFDKLRVIASTPASIVVTNLAVGRGLLLPAGGDLPAARSDLVVRVERGAPGSGEHVLVAMKCPFQETSARVFMGPGGLSPA